MKQTLTLIVACLISVSLFGQTENTRTRELDKFLFPVNQIKANEYLGMESVNFPMFSKTPYDKRPVSKLKSTQIIKHRLDSIVGKSLDVSTGEFIFSSKTVFSYDANGNTILELNYTRDKYTGKWISASKSERRYDSNSNQTVQMEFSWDKSLGKWKGSYKIEFAYDSNGNMIQYNGYAFNSVTNDWVNTYKYEEIFDSNGKETQKIQYKWDNLNSKWINFWKYEPTYDSKGNRVTGISFIWDKIANTWVASNKSSYIYDSNGNFGPGSDYKWDKITSQWREWGKSENTYDSNGRLTLHVFYDWDNGWTNGSKIENVYDSNGNKTLNTVYRWSKFENQWLKRTQVGNAYDSNGNTTMKSSCNWDQSGIQIIDFYKTETTYNLDYSIDVLILPDGFFANTRNMPTFNIGYGLNQETGQWDVVNIKGDFYYSPIDFMGVVDEISNAVTVYPNPVTHGFRVIGLGVASTLILTDLSGKVCFAKKVMNSEYVSTTTLPQGIYFVRINTPEGSIVKKLVKR